MNERSPFNHLRLVLARKRRKMTAIELAIAAGISRVHLSRIERGQSEPNPETVDALAEATRYPHGFFFLDGMCSLPAEAVSFRSLKKTSVRERDAARAAGEIGVDVGKWLLDEFNLPEPALPDMSHDPDPATASRALRQEWGLGEKPVASMISLLEAKGTRVFSLCEETLNVDAFSFWQDGVPYVFLNTMKTAEHGYMDAAHELGHLVLHAGGNTLQGRDVEREANVFASSFLMPSEDVLGRVPRGPSVERILGIKKRWRVSAMALANRVYRLGLLTDWQYRSMCIELTRRGYRTGEPDGTVRDKSRVWNQILNHLWSEGKTKKTIADALHLPLNEFDRLTFGLVADPVRPERREPLRVVK
jgi:Zn-dependent peptidase ImmA (M78 family)/DNA-binding XRE family transcriptional regulator